MLTVLVAWFSTTLGKTIAKCTIVAGIGAVVLTIYESGKRAEKTEQTESDLKAVVDREKTDEKTDALPDAAVRDQLGAWVQHD